MYADKVKKAFFAASKARKRDGESASRRDFNVVFQRSLSAPSLRFGTKLWATQNVAPKRLFSAEGPLECRSWRLMAGRSVCLLAGLNSGVSEAPRFSLASLRDKARGDILCRPEATVFR